MTFQSNLNAAQSETQQNNIMNSFIQYYVDNEINKLKQVLVDAAPENLDNLKELGDALAAEIARATAAEVALGNDINAEEVARQAAIDLVNAAVVAEQTRVDALIASDMWLFDDQASFPAAADNHGRVVHSHADGAQFFAHGGAWIRLATSSEVNAAIYDDTALDARVAALEVDPTTKTYVDTQDALALPKAGGSINVNDDATFVYNKKLTLASLKDVVIDSEENIKIIAEEDYDIELQTQAAGAVRAIGRLIVNYWVEISHSFQDNITRIENTKLGTSFNIGNNIQMNPAPAGGRVEINGGLLLDASDQVNAANDTAAAAAGVAVGQIYHNNGELRIRIS